MVDKFSMMSFFILSNKENDATHISKSYFNEVARLHGIPRLIVLDRHTNFHSHF